MSADSIRSPWFWLTALALALLALFVLYPLLSIVGGSFSGEGPSGWAQLVSTSKYREAVLNTLILASSVTVICTLIGVPLAYVTARYSFRGKALIALLPLITLVIPEVIAAQTWLMMLGNNGLITKFLREFGIRLPSFYGWFGLITSMSFIYYTYVYIGTVAAIGKFDVQLEEAAQSLGTPPGRALDATALFLSQDSRWRLLRPLPAADDPDALSDTLAVTPDQVQYLVRPVPGAAYVQLVLVGLPQSGRVAWPALAGRLGPPAGDAAGQIFTIQPDEPETCALDADAAAAQTQALLARHLNLKPRD